MKLWDLSTQHCVQAIVAHRAEVWSLGLNLEQDLLLTGSNDGELRAWKIDPSVLIDGIKESENGEVRPSFEGVVFSLMHPHTALKSDTPHIDTSSRIGPSHLSNCISPHTSLSFCPIA